MGIRKLRPSHMRLPLRHVHGILAAIAVMGVLFAVLGGALLPHDHAPDEAGHRCPYCQIAAAPGGPHVSSAAAAIAPPPPTGEGVLAVEAAAPTPPASSAGRPRDPPRA